ncbi:hypothetical protein PCAR4_470018 [Paraburkholderia caribensis]|nr:hypothetical protein PCAR4_470018 [Paraburkholderia caribensis]
MSDCRTEPHLHTRRSRRPTANRPNVVDADAGIVEPPWSQRVDTLPSDLIARSYGRLKSNCDTDSLGLLSTYVTDTGIWTSERRAAARIPKVPIAVLDAIARFYKLSFRKFFDTPRD